MASHPMARALTRATCRGRHAVQEGPRPMTGFRAGLVAGQLLIHEVAIVRPELGSEPYIQRIMAHHTTAREAGTIFARAKPKLAVFTHLVFLGNQQIPPASVHDLLIRGHGDHTRWTTQQRNVRNSHS